MIKSVGKSEYRPVQELHAEMYGLPVCKQTVSRWKKHGKTTSGQLRTLKTVFLGGKTCTTREWLADFMEDHIEPSPAMERGPTTKQLERAKNSAESFLAAEGI
ncbi:hypothetical protein SH449x_000955 [Pirellulaceae bacterium SH449]